MKKEYSLIKKYKKFELEMGFILDFRLRSIVNHLKTVLEFDIYLLSRTEIIFSIFGTGAALFLISREIPFELAFYTPFCHFSISVARN